MNKTIYKYLLYEFMRYFVATLFSLAAIVWVVQAVNFLDLITEDGHAFGVYFYYSFLTLSKVLTKLIPFCFLISIVLTILKLFHTSSRTVSIFKAGTIFITISVIITLCVV